MDLMYVCLLFYKDIFTITYACIYACNMHVDRFFKCILHYIPIIHQHIINHTGSKKLERMLLRKYLVVCTRRPGISSIDSLYLLHIMYKAIFYVLITLSYFFHLGDSCQSSVVPWSAVAPSVL